MILLSVFPVRVSTAATAVGPADSLTLSGDNVNDNTGMSLSFRMTITSPGLKYFEETVNLFDCWRLGTLSSTQVTMTVVEVFPAGISADELNWNRLLSSLVIFTVTGSADTRGAVMVSVNVSPSVSTDCEAVTPKAGCSSSSITRRAVTASYSSLLTLMLMTESASTLSLSVTSILNTTPDCPAGIVTVLGMLTRESAVPVMSNTRRVFQRPERLNLAVIR